MPTAYSTRRLVAVSAALFLIILAFLAGRVHAGADPTQATTPASNVTPAEPAPAPAPAPAETDPGGAPDADPPATFAS